MRACVLASLRGRPSDQESAPSSSHRDTEAANLTPQVVVGPHRKRDNETRGGCDVIDHSSPLAAEIGCASGSPGRCRNNDFPDSRAEKASPRGTSRYYEHSETRLTDGRPLHFPPRVRSLCDYPARSRLHRELRPLLRSSTRTQFSPNFKVAGGRAARTSVPLDALLTIRSSSAFAYPQATAR